MFYFDELNGKKVLKSDLLKEVTHCFTTRECPIRGNEDEYKNLYQLNRLISPIQTHTNIVEIVDERAAYPETDGLILSNVNDGIYLSFADCTPLIFYDTANKIGAISHAGWRGTAGKIAVVTIEKMKNVFQSKPENIKVLIGPAISKCCYEVGEDVLSKLLSTVKDKSSLSEGNFVDLKAINARQLQEIGVKQIDICPYCTSCDNDIFFSYRKENGTPLRHNAFITLKQQ